MMIVSKAPSHPTQSTGHFIHSDLHSFEYHLSTLDFFDFCTKAGLPAALVTAAEKRCEKNAALFKSNFSAEVISPILITNNKNGGFIIHIVSGCHLLGL